MFEFLGLEDLKNPETISLISLIFGAIISPLIIWASRKIYDSFTLAGIYINALPATGTAPGINMPFEGLDFSISVRIINTTNKIQVLEKILLMWKNVKSENLPELINLMDHAPEIREFLLKEKTVSEFYENLNTVDTLLPIILPPNGGTVFLEIKSVLGFYKRDKILFQKRFFPDLSKANEIDFVNSIDRGKGLIKARISGKVRSYPIILWK